MRNSSLGWNSSPTFALVASSFFFQWRFHDEDDIYRIANCISICSMLRKKKKEKLILHTKRIDTWAVEGMSKLDYFSSVYASFFQLDQVNKLTRMYPMLTCLRCHVFVITVQFAAFVVFKAGFKSIWCVDEWRKQDRKCGGSESSRHASKQRSKRSESANNHIRIMKKSHKKRSQVLNIRHRRGSLQIPRMYSTKFFILACHSIDWINIIFSHWLRAGVFSFFFCFFCLIWFRFSTQHRHREWWMPSTCHDQAYTYFFWLLYLMCRITCQKHIFFPPLFLMSRPQNVLNSIVVRSKSNKNNNENHHRHQTKSAARWTHWIHRIDTVKRELKKIDNRNVLAGW